MKIEEIIKRKIKELEERRHLWLNELDLHGETEYTIETLKEIRYQIWVLEEVLNILQGGNNDI